MKHSCYISFKTEDFSYKKYIQDNLSVSMIDKSLNERINSDNRDYIMQRIRTDYLSDSVVTIFLIGQYSAENSPNQCQDYIKRELQASLYNGVGNTRNGILGVVLPEMKERIFCGSYTCSNCGKTHNTINIMDGTVIKEFCQNYYIEPHSHCGWRDEDRYCVLANWDDFVHDAEGCIEQAYKKRSEPIANKVVVFPK
jgi:hypothetical protein